MLDMAGIDVGARTVIENIKQGGFPPDPAYRPVCQELFRLGRFGQKTKVGYYAYPAKAPEPEPMTEMLSSELAERFGIEQRSLIAEEEIFQRLYFSMVNEAAKILEEGIATRASDIDVVWTLGYGFPKETWRTPLHGRSVRTGCRSCGLSITTRPSAATSLVTGACQRCFEDSQMRSSHLPTMGEGCRSEYPRQGRRQLVADCGPASAAKGISFLRSRGPLLFWLS